MHNEVLYEICDTLMDELRELNEKIKKAGGKMSAGDLEAVDKLTHAIKSVKTTIAMTESGESGRYRDSMGRYRRSYNSGIADELRDLMSTAPAESRRDFQRLIDKIDRA